MNILDEYHPNQLHEIVIEYNSSTFEDEPAIFYGIIMSIQLETFDPLEQSIINCYENLLGEADEKELEAWISELYILARNEYEVLNPKLTSLLSHKEFMNLELVEFESIDNLTILKMVNYNDVR